MSDTKPAQPEPRPPLAQRLTHGLHRLWRRFTRIWRSSLQFRIVVSTILLGLLVISMIGTYLFSAIANGLESERINRAQEQARSLTARAQVSVDAYQPREGDAQGQQAWDLVNTLVPAGNDQSLLVVFTRAQSNSAQSQLPTVSSVGVGLSAVSDALREAVSEDPTRQQTQLVQLTLDGTAVPAVVVGSQIDIPASGAYDLYFITPMRQEQATLRLITQALLLGGIALTFLTGAIAWLVVRQAVTPVRRAAAVAKRLEAGDLGERMPARGADDLAILATSFNSMADSLQQQIRQLEGLSQVQQRFVSDVSHELRTPLTTVRMAADLIYDSREEFSGPMHRSAELLHGELDRFEELLADLLEISRHDAGAAVLDAEPVNLAALIKRVVDGAAPLARRRGSEVVIEAPEGEVEVTADPRRVERIIRNLVVNAIEHGEGRPVTVLTAGNETAVSVLVVDQGVGLRPGEAGLVFNRFWRADPARARHSGGTGLGLAISLEDARLHRGWLQAWGSPGEGARFRLTLPRDPHTSIEQAPLPLSPPEDDES
ncbi:MAG: MtrAB system histidine kinase MtrB [Actinomycetia bacterium]|nr:MtrAB system histidine kinase MtrB [Actinomycetes bacterium]